MSAQTPVQTPPAVSPTPTSTPAPAPGIQIQLFPPGVAEYVPYIFGGLAAALAIVGIAYLLRGRISHPVAKNINRWLTTPGVDVLVLALDPLTREAKLIPCKRVGSVYVSTVEPVYLIPVEGGESYTLSGAGKPVLIALRYGRGALQWVPASEQLLSLSLAPVEASGGTPVTTVEKVEERLLEEVARRVSEVSGQTYIGPDLRLYISTRVPKALEEFKRYVAYSAAASLSVLSSSLHTVAEEGYKVLEAHRRLVATRWTVIGWVVMVVVIVVAVALFILRQAGLI